MKILFDALTPKQVRLMKVLHDHMKGHERCVLTRDKAEVQEVIKELKFHTITSGSHGITTIEKAKVRILRQRYIQSILEVDPYDLLISHVSPSATAAAFAFGVPIIQFNDTPWAYHTNILTLPLSNHLICSEAFNAVPCPWKMFAHPSMVIHYFKGVDEILWVRDWARNFKRKEEDPPVIIIREPEYDAAYANNTFPRVEDIIRELATLKQRFHLLVITRNDLPYYRPAKHITVEVTEYMNPLKIYERASYFIGIGGTMNREAAMLGIPSFTMFYYRFVNRYINKLGFPLYFAPVHYLAHRLYRSQHSNLKVWPKRLLEQMETPLEVLGEVVNGMI